MSDTAWHHTPDLVERLTDTIPTLVRSKQQTLDFFRSAGVPEQLLADVQERLTQNPGSIGKYQIARTIVHRLNEGGDRLLAARREVVRRVTCWEDYSSAWPNNQDRARGLVAAVRQMVDTKDSFTRMQQERDRERTLRIREQESQVEAQRALRESRQSIRKRLLGLRQEESPTRRGKLLESVIADLCRIEGVQVREPFEIRNAGTVEEQIDGAISVDGHLYLVEIKWWADPVEINAMSRHLYRLFRRSEARGLFISTSGYTAPAVKACRDVISQKTMLLAELNEIVALLEGESKIEDWIRIKANAAIVDLNPLAITTTTA